ncbi:phosphate ABC transporter permease subunit PstC [Carbonactinospora thermoautotrophica]|uniref:phosphate ABC transporter permease subunit PstC n=1 Tax=Carbonactinospora thermoautotrophica TaxID=1469144 RepID=UPI00226E63D8|nr:phosphate ABC transporter permease subunit PstC [Carbonactinospora thermoautotrophica]MCX9193486.1 phosphate ABC transporter permease subunit PstC [Carbonactinospora thermoautotrophica]
MTTNSVSNTAPGTVRRSLGRTRPRYGERVIQVVLLAAALVSVATTVGIVVSLVPPTVEFFSQVSWREFFGGTDWAPLFNPPGYGVWPLVTATLLITGIAILVAVPLGLASAIYLSEYATPRTRTTFKPILEILAGIPTVVYGFFALKFVTPQLQHLLPVNVDVFNALAAGIVMGIMIIPTVASLSEDAMAAVPQALRHGAYALGSTKRTVSLRVVVPAALSGIVAAIVLGLSRAVGETMIVAIAAGNQPNLTFNPLQAMQTMTGFIASAGSGDLPTASLHYKTIFAVGALLFVLTFAMNFLSIRLVRRFREVYE